MDNIIQNNIMLKKQYDILKSNHKCYVESLIIVQLSDKLITTDDIDTNKKYLQGLYSEELTEINEEEFQNVYYMTDGLSVIIGCDIEFPFKPPKVKLTKSIFHPNVDINGIMKFTMIDSEWCVAMTLLSLVDKIKEVISIPDCRTYNNREALSKFIDNKSEYYKLCVECVISINLF